MNLKSGKRPRGATWGQYLKKIKARHCEGMLNCKISICVIDDPIALYNQIRAGVVH